MKIKRNLTEEIAMEFELTKNELRSAYNEYILKKMQSQHKYKQTSNILNDVEVSQNVKNELSRLFKFGMKKGNYCRFHIFDATLNDIEKVITKLRECEKFTGEIYKFENNDNHIFSFIGYDVCLEDICYISELLPDKLCVGEDLSVLSENAKLKKENEFLVIYKNGEKAIPQKDYIFSLLYEDTELNFRNHHTFEYSIIDANGFSIKSYFAVLEDNEDKLLNSLIEKCTSYDYGIKNDDIER